MMPFRHDYYTCLYIVVSNITVLVIATFGQFNLVFQIQEIDSIQVLDSFYYSALKLLKKFLRLWELPGLRPASPCLQYTTVYKCLFGGI